MKSLSEQVRYHRTKKKLSQEDLACWSGISFDEIQKIEDGFDPQCQNTISALSIALGVNLVVKSLKRVYKKSA